MTYVRYVRRVLHEHDSRQEPKWVARIVPSVHCVRACGVRYEGARGSSHGAPPRASEPHQVAHGVALSPKTKSDWKMPTHMPSSPPTAMSFHSSSSKTGCSTPSNSAHGSACHGEYSHSM